MSSDLTLNVPSPNVALPNPATIWARVIIDELVRAGVREVCLAPGSRSTPLVLAAAGRDELRMRVFIDERSAAFFALGLAKGSGTPAVVLTTSGTAVANLLPAAVEAHQAEVPLILLTADRPPRLRDLDANQAIHQPGIFGVNTRWAADLALPSLDEAALRHLRGQVVRGVALARGLPAGPVHLNVPFDKPLEPSADDDAWWHAHGAETRAGAGAGTETGAEAGAGADHNTPFTRISLQRSRLGDADIKVLVEAVRQSKRGVIVAGAHPEATELGPLLRAFAARTGFVLLADPLSGARSRAAADSDAARPDAAIASAASLWLGDAAIAQALAPDLIVRIGAAPTSAAVLSWVERHGGGPDRARQIVIDAGQRWKDHTASATDLFRGCPIDTLTRVLADLKKATPEVAAWTKQWMAADSAARQAVEAATGLWHEGHVAQAVVRAVARSETPLFVSSSMPIRDVDAYGGAALTSVQGNRGASGIDGIVSTALGVAAGAGQPVVALIGDLALLHDMNGLLATREPDACVIFVVVQNDGGGIFHMLPIAEHEPAFTPFFATPHGRDVAQIAALYDLPHRCVESPEELQAAVEQAVRDAGQVAPGAGPVSQVIEIRTDREANRAGHARVRSAVRAAVAEVLDIA